MKSILVASDLSNRSDVAIKRAVAIAQKTGAQLHAVNVVDADLPPEIGMAQRDGAERFMKAQLAKCGETAPEKVNIQVVLGDACSEIARTAQDLNADLVVLGRHRNRGLAEFFVGTTSERLLRIAKRPVLVATRDTGPYAHAVVGIDMSDCAANAIKVARDLVGQDNMTVVHAYHAPFKGLTMRTDRHGALTDHDKGRIEAEIRDEINAWADRNGMQGEGAKVELQEGSAVDILPWVATRAGADLICIGAHSRSWLPKAILGSTAAELLSYSDCDILVAPLRAPLNAA